MGDVDKGDLVLILQLLEQVDDVHFHGSIDSRNRFVGNDQLRTGDKRTCNGNTLQLAAGELGGVFALYDRQREADALQGVIYKVCSFCFVFRNAKAQRRVEQVRVYRLTCGERLIRVLENRLHFQLELLCVVAFLIEVRLAVQHDVAHIRVVQTQNHLTQCGLAATGFANDGEDDRLIVVDGKRNVVNRNKLFATNHTAYAEDFADALDFKQFISHSSLPPSSANGRLQSGPA